MKKARITLKLSQQQVADRVGVSKESVRQWETSCRSIRYKYLRPLCDMLQLTPHEVTEGRESEVPAATAPAELAEKLEQLERDVRNMSEQIAWLRSRFG